MDARKNILTNGCRYVYEFISTRVLKKEYAIDRLKPNQIKDRVKRLATKHNIAAEQITVKFRELDIKRLTENYNNDVRVQGESEREINFTKIL